MTFQTLINSVMDNLGDRSSGQIGQQSTDVVVMSAINKALPQCVKLGNPEYYDGTKQITIASGSATEIALPTVTIGTTEHRIKDVVYTRSSRGADNTPVSMTKKTWSDFIKLTPDYDQQLEGIPSLFSFRQGNLYLNRKPTEAYKLTLYVELWPKELTSEDLNTPLPINSEWELAMEAFATYYCYLKLQQVPLAAYWKDLYEEQKRINVQQVRKTDNRSIGGGGVSVAGEPFLNPFVRRFN